ncbi:helix-turn-helix domain-containing protein [Streptomyces sp. SID13726]|uniref:HTH domain-containing protein n=1 Tax=Streptomyces sp. SID13726 TaxID=2706058 RepID=UPI0013B7E038|nr:helix-turn-helix domain-containing protein [Streptomyces sp. SID13726]
MTRADRLTLVRQLADEGLSRRRIAQRLGVSKDTVRRDLEKLRAAAEPVDEPLAEPPGEPGDVDEPQVSEAVSEEGAPVDEPGGEPLDEPVGARVAQLPRRVAHADDLLIDLRRWPALRRDLAVLAATGLSPDALINQAVVVLAFGYRQAVLAGRIQPGQPFVVRDLTVGPPGSVPRRTGSAPPAEGA